MRKRKRRIRGRRRSILRGSRKRRYRSYRVSRGGIRL